MHPLAWLVWLGASAVATLAMRNPLYLLLLFAVIYVVTDVIRGAESGRGGATTASTDAVTEPMMLPVSPIRFALFAMGVGALINGLISPFGETELLRLPEVIPLLGGPITAEAVVYGAINGMVLATLFATFAVLNVAVPTRDLIGYLPRAFYPVAVVSAIAITFVPNTLYQLRQVREAQAIRGHRMRGLRDWLPLFLPVLIGGLERALQLAEAMTARGFAAKGAAAPAAHTADIARFASIGGLAAVLVGGVLRLVPGAGRWSPVLVVGGTLLVAWAIWRSGRQVNITRYRRARWTMGDGVMVVGALLALVPLFLWPATRDYSPYPRLLWPSFDTRVGLALLGFLAPALVLHLARPPAQGERQ